MKIYKYVLEITDRQVIEIGKQYATPLSVGEQNGKLVMWAVVEDDFAKRGLIGNDNYEIVVDIIGTGRNCETNKRFLGTVVMSYGLVWHVFAECEKGGEV